MQNERVLIYRLGSLGDTLVALPALRVIASRYPTAHRYMLTNHAEGVKAAPMATILEGTGLVDGCIEYPLRTRRMRDLVRLWRTVRSYRPSVLIYLAAPRAGIAIWRDALFFKLCGVRCVIGIPYKRSLRERRQLKDGSYEQEGERLLRTLGVNSASVRNDPSMWELPLAAQIRNRASELLGPLQDSKGVVAISVGAKADVKDWGIDNWRNLIQELSERMPDWGLVCLGATAEWTRSDELCRMWDGPALNFCGRITVKESAAVLQKATLFIGHDSGPMHLAASVQTPCVAIFSSRNLPGEWFPWGDRHRILYREMACQGCRLEACNVYKKACIMSIMAPEVVDATEELLKRLRTV